MRKIGLFLFFLTASCYLLAAPASADFNSAYQDYVYSQQQYKNAHNSYQIAKSAFQTYGTLTAQNDAIAKFKSVLQTRNQVVSSYFDLLQERLNTAEGVAPDQIKTFSAVRDNEKKWLSENQTQIEAAESLEDLNKISSKFASQYPQILEETKQVTGSILVAKEEVLRGKLNINLANFSQKIAELRSAGENTTSADRGLITIQDKLNFQSGKVESAKLIFSGNKTNYSREGINLLSGQKELIEANQYLKEATNNLLELVRSFTG